jgi:hypothetical protein
VEAKIPLKSSDSKPLSIQKGLQMANSVKPLSPLKGVGMTMTDVANSLAPVKNLAPLQNGSLQTLKIPSPNLSSGKELPKLNSLQPKALVPMQNAELITASRNENLDDDFDVSSASSIKLDKNGGFPLAKDNSDGSESEGSEIKPVANHVPDNKPHVTFQSQKISSQPEDSKQKNSAASEAKSLDLEKQKSDLSELYTIKLLQFQQEEELKFESNRKSLRESFAGQLEDLSKEVKKALTCESNLIRNELIIEHVEGFKPKIVLSANECVQPKTALYDLHSKFRKDFEAGIQELALEVMTSYAEKEANLREDLEDAHAKTMNKLENEYSAKLEREKNKAASGHQKRIADLYIEEDVLAEKKQHQLKESQKKLHKLKLECDSEAAKFEELKEVWEERIEKSKAHWKSKLDELEDGFRAQEAEYMKRAEKATLAIEKNDAIERNQHVLDTLESDIVHRRNCIEKERLTLIDQEAELESRRIKTQKAAAQLDLEAQEIQVREHNNASSAGRGMVRPASSQGHQADSYKSRAHYSKYDIYSDDDSEPKYKSVTAWEGRNLDIPGSPTASVRVRTPKSGVRCTRC